MGSQATGSSSSQRAYSYHHQNYNRLPGQAAIVHSPAMSAQAFGTKAKAESAYPSPADDFKHSIAPPSPSQRHAHVSLATAAPTLPPLRELLNRPMSPSTSPHIPAASCGTYPGSPASAPIFRNTLGNSYTDNSHHASDPQLFPDQCHAANIVERHQPLFPSPRGPTLRPYQMTTKITPHQRKRAPMQAPLPSPLEPARNPHTSIWAMAASNPAQWIRDRRDEDETLWPSSNRTESIGTDTAILSSPRGTTERLSGKRELDRRDSVTQGPPTKRARTQRRENQDFNRAGTRTSPRETLAPYFDTILDDAPKKPKPAVKHAAAPVQPSRKIKQANEEPDFNYKKYSNFTPDVSTLDDAGVNFTANWGGKPLNLDADPDRRLLHEKEVKLATKLALTCARYLYLKRRFFAGRLDFARRSQVYNINAAQQQCKGQDVYGIVGADVNKTSSMWKAFNSVGWLDESHMRPFINGLA